LSTRSVKTFQDDHLVRDFLHFVDFSANLALNLSLSCFVIILIPFPDPQRIGEERLMDFSIPFRHVHADEMDSSSMAAVSDDLFCPVHDGSVVDSRGVKPSLGQYTDEMVLSFFAQTVELVT
jgi:hypothetical protein